MSSVDSNEVDSVVRALVSNRESTTLEAEENEYPPEVIAQEDDEDSLANLYRPPNEEDSGASVKVDSEWLDICVENKFCVKGPEYFAFSDWYELVLPAVRSRVTDGLAGHVSIYVQMLDLRLSFPLDPFIFEIFQAWNIFLSQLKWLGWRNLIAYAWTIRFRRFPETLNLLRKLHWIKEDGSAKGKGGWKKKRSRTDEDQGRAG